MNRRRARRGTALVEFALVFPLLIAMLIGIIDIGFLYNHQLVLTNAAREGARLGSLGQTTTQVRTGVTTYLNDSDYSPMPPAGNIDVALANGMIAVTITSTVPFLFAMSGPALTIRAVTRMRVE